VGEEMNIELLLVIMAWMVATSIVFRIRDVCNSDCQYEFLRATWEPYAISIGLLMMAIGHYA